MDGKEWARELRVQVIESALSLLGRRYVSEAATRLLIMTAAHESHLLMLRQRVRWLGDNRYEFGPALGLFQMEAATHQDIWASYLAWRPALAARVLTTCGTPKAEQMVGNLTYAAVMARIHYWRVGEPLPAPGDIDGLAGYAKRYWNTEAGKATADDYADAFRRLHPGL